MARKVFVVITSRDKEVAAGVGIRYAFNAATRPWMDEVKITAEFRCLDGSANIYLLLAGLAVAARHGLEMNNALELASKLYVDVNIFSPEHEGVREKLPQLPTSCWESTENLLRDREIYQRDGVFSSMVIDETAKKLRDYDDKALNERLYGKEDETRELLDKYLHCS